MNPSSPVIEHIIAVNRALGCTQIAQMFTYCLQSLDIRLNYYFTLNEQRTELHNNKSWRCPYRHKVTIWCDPSSASSENDR